MSTRTEAAHALGVATGRREATELVVQFLRNQLAQWDAAAEPKTFREKLGREFFAAVTSSWRSRVEATLTALEQELVKLRSREQSERLRVEQLKGWHKWL